MANSRKLLGIDAIDSIIDPFIDSIVGAVEHCLERYVQPTQHVAVALSGGMDSVCLLHVLASKISVEKYRFYLSALHVHHGLSPYADRWASFCQDYCDSLKIPCEIKHVVVPRQSSEGLEGSARRVRHAVFAASAADWVMLAHQRDDQAETVLFNLLRGTGVAGAAAMRECNAHLLRPLLSIGRNEITHYVDRYGLPWCEDESNADIRYARNFLRQRIFRELTGRFPAAVTNLANAATRFAEAKNLIDTLAQVDLANLTSPDLIARGDHFPLSVNGLKTLDEARGRNVLRYLLAKNQVQIPSEARLCEAVRQMIDAAADRHPVVRFGRHLLVRRRGWIYLEPVVERDDNG